MKRLLVLFILPSSFDIESINDKVLIFQQQGKNLSRAFRAKTKTIIWPGRSELSSDENHRRTKIMGPKTSDSSLILQEIETTNPP